MKSKYFRIGIHVFAIIVIIAVLAALLLPEPQCAWNSGAWERVRESLKAIGQRLTAENEHDKLDPNVFIPRNSDSASRLIAQDTNQLVELYGIRVKLRRNGIWSDVLFYPVAIADDVVFTSDANDKPRPQLVMVPIDAADEKKLPNLSGCSNETTEEARICRLRRMKELFAAYGVTHPIALLSDGTVMAVPVDEL